ncbi:MAG: hypothetical protein QXO19_03940, partial [Candidatus Aenigmatarchaeota archaeon]
MNAIDLNVIDLINGDLKNYNSIQKRYLSDLKDYFANKQEVDRILKTDNPLVYTVYEMNFDQPGSLSYA